MTVEIVDPATGQVTYRHELMGAADIEQRLQAAADAFPGWADRSLQDRGAILRQIAAQLRTRRDDLQQAMTHEMGKLKAEALAEVDKCAAACEYYADVPQCADLILAVCRDGGLPDGVFDVLHIDNDQAADVLRDARVKAVTLTGSERAGRSIASNAGSQLKKSVMELGGSDAFVVLDDADLDKTVAAAVKSRFDNSGQTCIAAKRFIVVEAVADEFTRRFVQAAGERQYGDPDERGTTLAPMARADLRDELHKQVQASVSKGARVLIGGEPIAGTHAGYPATVLDQVGPGMPAYDEELFGPVAAVIRVKDEAEALRVANDTRFGLGGSVWTGDPVRGERFAQRMECGAAFVNAIVKSDARLPFGGSKQSGFGRELADHGIHEFMNIKTVYVA